MTTLRCKSTFGFAQSCSIKVESRYDVIYTSSPTHIWQYTPYFFLDAMCAHMQASAGSANRHINIVW